MGGKKKIHPGARTGVARGELLRAYITDPRAHQGMKKVLNIILVAERQRLAALPAMCEGVHRSPEAADHNLK